MPSTHTKWEKPLPQTIALFEELVPEGVERRKMFGFPCAFVNGHMFMWIHQNHIVVRLPEAERSRLADNGQAEPVDESGQRMREYVALDPQLTSDINTAHAIIDNSLSYVSALPPKVRAGNKRS